MAVKVNFVVPSMVTEPRGEQRMSLEDKKVSVFDLFQFTAVL